MGQAKRRGTYQERRTIAIEKAGIDREEFKRLKLAKEAAMTKEQRQKKHDAEIALMQLMASYLSMGSLPFVARGKAW